MRDWLLRFCVISIFLSVFQLGSPPKSRRSDACASADLIPGPTTIFTVRSSFLSQLSPRNLNDEEHDCADFSQSEKSLWALLQKLLACASQNFEIFSFCNGVAHRQNSDREGFFDETIARKVSKVCWDLLASSKKKEDKIFLYCLFAFVQGFLQGNDDKLWEQICSYPNFNLVEVAFTQGANNTPFSLPKDDLLLDVFNLGEKCASRYAETVSSGFGSQHPPSVPSDFLQFMNAVVKASGGPKYDPYFGRPDPDATTDHLRSAGLMDDSPFPKKSIPRFPSLEDALGLPPRRIMNLHDSSLKRSLLAEVKREISVNLSEHALWIQGFCLGHKVGNEESCKAYEALLVQLTKFFYDTELLEFCDGYIQGFLSRNRPYELDLKADPKAIALFNHAADRAIPDRHTILLMVEKSNINKKSADSPLQLIPLMQLCGYGTRAACKSNVIPGQDYQRINPADSYWEEYFKLVAIGETLTPGTRAAAMRKEHDKIVRMKGRDRPTGEVLATLDTIGRCIQADDEATQTAQRLLAARTKKANAACAKPRIDPTEKRLAEEAAKKIADELEAEEARAAKKVAQKKLKRASASNKTSIPREQGAPPPFVAVAATCAAGPTAVVPDATQTTLIPPSAILGDPVPTKAHRKGKKKPKDSGPSTLASEPKKPSVLLSTALPAPLVLAAVTAPTGLIVGPHCSSASCSELALAEPCLGAGSEASESLQAFSGAGAGSSAQPTSGVDVLLPAEPLAAPFKDVRPSEDYYLHSVLPASSIPALSSEQASILSAERNSLLQEDSDFCVTEHAEPSSERTLFDPVWIEQRNLGLRNGYAFAAECVRDNLSAFDELLRAVDYTIASLSHDSITNHPYLMGLKAAYLKFALELCKAFNDGIALGFAERGVSNNVFLAHQYERQAFLQKAYPNRMVLINYYHALGCCFGFHSSAPFVAPGIAEVDQLLRRGPDSPIQATNRQGVNLCLQPIARQLAWSTPEEFHPLTTGAAFQLGVKNGIAQFVANREGNPHAITQSTAFANTQMAQIAAVNPHDLIIHYWHGFKSGAQEAHELISRSLKKGVSKGCALAIDGTISFEILKQNLERSLALANCLPNSLDALNRQMYLTALKVAVEVEEFRADRPEGYRAFTAAA